MSSVATISGRHYAAAPSPSQAPPKRKSRWLSRVLPERAQRAKAANAHALLCVDDVTVSFDGFRALDSLTMILNDGELRCIIGPNGAGKTTLMDVITGKTRPDSGTVFFVHDLHDLTTLSEHAIARKGIGRKFQRPTVFFAHTLRENVELALRAKQGVFRSIFSGRSREENTFIDEHLERVGLLSLANATAGSLSHGQKQWLEIGMLLAQRPRVLLVDEPVAGMTPAEVETTAELLRSLREHHTVVVVEHDMDFVRSLDADCVTVLHEGRLLSQGSLAEVQADKRVIEVYLGE